jgi:putative NADPH-quinone reductase
MRVLVIYCHPVEQSFAAAAHRAVLQALAQAGHQVTDVDLYAEHFDPVMSRQERLDYLNTERNERLVQRYDDQLVATEALVLVYPAWWYGMPAMLKGYFDRVWLPGVAFDVTPDGTVKTDRLKALRRILVVTTYGGSWWMVRVALGDPARKIISRAVRALCARDCRVTWCVHYSMDRARPPALRRFLQRVRRAALRLHEA